MVFKCCVPMCRGSYKDSPKVHLFQLPASEAGKQKWIKAIPRQDFKPTKYTRVCHVHFKESDIQWEASCYNNANGELLTVPYKRPKLCNGAVPSVFPGCPTYMTSQGSSRENPEDKRERLEAELLSRAISDSIEVQSVYDNKRRFSTFEQFLKCNEQNKVSNFWDVLRRENCVIYINLITVNIVELAYSVVVTDNLLLSVHYKGTEVKSLGSKYKFPLEVSNINVVHDILELIEQMELAPFSNISSICDVIQSALLVLRDKLEEKDTLLQFMSSQVELVQQKKERFRYSSDTIIFSSLLYFLSPHAYKFIRHSGNIILPHPSTIRKVCSSYDISPQMEQNDNNFLGYIKDKVTTLKSQECSVVLMVDEVHIKQYIDYKGGNIVGMAFDNENAASSAHVFMIQSVMSQFKDVVHILPVNTLNAETLHAIIKRVILGLENIGFRVICVITDNNSINRKAMSSFASPPQLSIVYPHPADSSRPLFFVVDPVHILKCLRNNWINQRNSDQCMFYPKFDSSSDAVITASFSTLQKMYNLESDKLIKYGYGLSLKALWPSNLERQNVKLVVQIFNRYIIESLLELGPRHDLPHFKGTADLIEIITTWWEIVNVKSPYKGKRLNNALQEPMTNQPLDIKAVYLRQVLNWLDKWGDMKMCTGIFTKETHLALKMTTHALLELTSYCVTELGMSYVLLGKFQTDALEARFGQYRQLAGSQYHISIRQVYEVEKKLRMSSVMSLELPSGGSGHFIIKHFGDIGDLDSVNENCDISEFTAISVCADDISNVEVDLPVITYLSGYCAYAVLKKLKCALCKDKLVVEKVMDTDTSHRLIRNLDRGGLLYPQTEVVNAVLHNYIIVKKLISKDYEKCFSNVTSQRLVAINLTVNVLSERECFSTWDDSEIHHSSEEVIKMVIWASTNTLLNNYCKLKNDLCCSNRKTSKKRKLATVMNS